MGLRDWLWSRDLVVLGLIRDGAANCVACADALLALFQRYESLAEQRQDLKDLEHKGDQIARSLFDAVARKLPTPFDPQDVEGLARAFDDVANCIYTATNRLFLYEITKPTQEMRRFAELLLAQTQELAGAVALLGDRGTWEEAARRTVEVHRLEKEADRLLNECMLALFRGNDPIQILKLKEVYETLETATDKCEDAADVVANVVRKRGGRFWVRA